jgi:hypothetical protein
MMASAFLAPDSQKERRNAWLSSQIKSSRDHLFFWKKEVCEAKLLLPEI